MTNPENPETYSLALRVRRVTCEDAYVAVPVTRSLTKENADGTRSIDFEAFVAEAIRISADPRVQWKLEESGTEPHPEQGPKPDGRNSFDAHYAGEVEPFHRADTDPAAPSRHRSCQTLDARKPAMHVSLLDFLRTGHFGSISGGSARSQVLEALGPPPVWSAKVSLEKALIWKYGDVEFHFAGDSVACIFSDHGNLVEGGETIEINPWVVRGGMTCQSMVEQLQQEGIASKVSQSPHDERQCVYVRGRQSVL